jgi:integrase/recombinase XerD
MNRKYYFEDDTEVEIRKFKTALEAASMNTNTIRQHANYAGIFLTWCKDEGLETEAVRYNEVIAFVRYLQKEGCNSRFINRVILAVRHYYNHLEAEKNPASGIYLRGNVHALPSVFVAYNDLLSHYASFEATDNRTKRNRVMLGLMIFQALTPEEIERLEPGHINIREAKIRIPGGRHANARTLDLQAVQLLDMQEYLQLTRLQMLKDVPKCRSGRKPLKTNLNAVKYQLFFSENGSGHLKRSLYHLFFQVKKINSQVTSAKVIRQSVIAQWLKEKGIRQVQYMAGHRFVSSTQRYHDYDMEELAYALKSHHPLE